LWPFLWLAYWVVQLAECSIFSILIPLCWFQSVSMLITEITLCWGQCIFISMFTSHVSFHTVTVKSHLNLVFMLPFCNFSFLSWTNCAIFCGPLYSVTFCWSASAMYIAVIRFVKMCWQGPFHYWWTRDITSDYNERSACWSQCRRNTTVSPGIPVHRWTWGGVSSRLETRTRNSKHHLKMSCPYLFLCCLNYRCPKSLEPMGILYIIYIVCSTRMFTPTLCIFSAALPCLCGCCSTYWDRQ
jgi:hypothetical protein